MKKVLCILLSTSALFTSSSIHAADKENDAREEKVNRDNCLSFDANRKRKPVFMFRRNMYEGFLIKHETAKDTTDSGFRLVSKYEGPYRNGLASNSGVVTFIDGATYKGQFKDGRYNGEGTMTYPDGSQYRGKWKDGRSCCEGVLIEYAADPKPSRSVFRERPLRTLYEGGFKDGYPEGEGTLTLYENAVIKLKYVGGFKQGRAFGRGIAYLYDSGGFVILTRKGRWDCTYLGE